MLALLAISLPKVNFFTVQGHLILKATTRSFANRLSRDYDPSYLGDREMGHKSKVSLSESTFWATQ